MKKSITLIRVRKKLSLCFISLLIPFHYCFSQTSFQGPNSPATASEQNYTCLSCPGSDWLPFTNIKVNDGMYAKATLVQYPQCFMTQCYFTRGLIAEDLGFSVPANSTITGIKAEVLKKASIDSISDYYVKLIQGSDTASLNKALPDFWPLVSLSYTQYGDSNDTWGVNWTASQMDSANFSLVFKAQNNKQIVMVDTAYVDHIRLTVYYTTPTGLKEHQSSDDNLSVSFNYSEQAIIIRRSVYASPVSEIIIYNTIGKKVYNKSFANTGMASTEEIRNLKLHEGIYLVELRGGASSYCRKLLITQ